MFCVNCGKQIVDDAKFCSFCGTPVRNVVVQPPVSTPITEQPIQEAPAAENPIAEQPVREILEDENTITEQPVQEAPAAENPVTEQPVPEAPAAENPVTEQPVPEAAASTENNFGGFAENPVESPLPGIIPTSGESVPQNVIGAIPEASKNPPKEHPERKYTLGHIMICLAAVAVMAITAGVFAGLYFSVV